MDSCLRRFSGEPREGNQAQVAIGALKGDVKARLPAELPLKAGCLNYRKGYHYWEAMSLGIGVSGYRRGFR